MYFWKNLLPLGLSIVSRFRKSFFCTGMNVKISLKQFLSSILLFRRKFLATIFFFLTFSNGNYVENKDLFDSLPPNLSVAFGR
jgi:hypothetical protein